MFAPESFPFAEVGTQQVFRRTCGKRMRHPHLSEHDQNTDLAQDVPDPEEAAVFESLRAIAHKAEVWKNTQGQRRGRLKRKLYVNRIAVTAGQANKGTLKLPDLDLDSDQEWAAVRALLDSGSSAHVVDAKKHTPGAKVQPPPKGTRGFQRADGETLPNVGAIVTPMKAETTPGQDGWSGSLEFKSAKIPLPRSSTRLVIKRENEARHLKNDGDIVDVYVVKICVPTDVTNGCCSSQAFVRPEAAWRATHCSVSASKHHLNCKMDDADERPCQPGAEHDGNL